MRISENKYLCPWSWYQDPGTRILIPRSWYQDLGTKILVARTQRSIKWNKRSFWKFGPRIFRPYRSASFFEANNFRKNGLPTNKDLFSGNREVQIYDFRDFYLFKNHGIWFETGPYGMIFRAMPCHYFSVPRFSVPCRANIFPCHDFPCRAVP